MRRPALGTGCVCAGVDDKSAGVGARAGRACRKGSRRAGTCRDTANLKELRLGGIGI